MYDSLLNRKTYELFFPPFYRLRPRVLCVYLFFFARFYFFFYVGELAGLARACISRNNKNEEDRRRGKNSLDMEDENLYIYLGAHFLQGIYLGFDIVLASHSKCPFARDDGISSNGQREF